jgi:putative tryptophan/tyrosine transport system substrate-binding protein
MTTASRRRFVQGVGAVGLAMLVGCGNPFARAGPPPKVARIGWLGPGGDGAAFQRGMAELGYVEGQHYVIEYRGAGDQPSPLPEAAAELVQLPVDVIVTGQGLGTMEAARDATSTIPIVISSAVDPVGRGLVASRARPGSNVTGLATLQSALGGKRLELLKETLPGASRFAVLFAFARGDVVPPPRMDLPAPARALGVELRLLRPQNPEEYEEAILAGVRERVDGLSVEAGGIGGRARIVALLAQYHLPTVYWDARFVRAGGLMSYGTSNPASYRRAAYYVDRILKGATPAELPIEEPREFDFAINLQTAQALGLTIPPAVLAQATEVLR